MEGQVGVIAIYKSLTGPSKGKIFVRRFERIGDYAEWSELCGRLKTVQILDTRMVELNKLYWENRFN